MRWLRGLFPDDFVIVVLLLMACICTLAIVMTPAPTSSESLLWFMAGLSAGT